MANLINVYLIVSDDEGVYFQNIYYTVNNKNKMLADKLFTFYNI